MGKKEKEKYSETCINWTQNKPEAVTWTQNKPEAITWTQNKPEACNLNPE